MMIQLHAFKNQQIFVAFKTRQKGFSLLELLVAFSIMAFSLGALYQAVGSSARSVSDTEQHQRAAVLAQSLLALRDSVPAEGWSQEGESAEFSWKITSAPFPTPAVADNSHAKSPFLHEVTIFIGWNGYERPQQLELQTLLPEHRAAPGAIKR